VPLNDQFPPERLNEIMDRAGVEVWLSSSLFLKNHGDKLHKKHVALVPAVQPGSIDMPPARMQAGDCVYTMFTSGSTGKPKGISISLSYLCSFIDNMQAIVQTKSVDRFSQHADLSF
jgi:acyl-coenzyme A synthetase/AMP-(fatty) acid ligase